MKSTLIISALVSLAALASSTPLLRQQQQQQQQHRRQAPSDRRIWQPDMYYIYPQDATLAKASVTGLHIEAFTNLSQIEQVAVFRGIPAGATNCVSGWSQANKTDRVFIVKGDSGLTRMRPLSGFPAPGEPVSYASIQPFDTAGETEQFGADFTLWDDEQYQQWDHTNGPVDCAEEIYIKVAIRDPLVKASVYMEQDTANGLWIDYQLE
ncbi:hypothetical protein S40288_05874 [Stachybotrys chartarum IBT 40288]|nr:hypothetical protein S40288_05874 [Stachybotrys chartarum IBT 40288]